MSTLKTVRTGLWLAVAALAAIALVAAFLLKSPAAPGTFNLTDHDGRPVTQAVLSGQPTLLFFGFTHCPDVCPTTLSEMTGWFETLGEEGKPLKAFFVTVDPERDTPEVMKGYVTALTDRITGLTGTRAEIDKAIAAWHIYAKKVPLSDGGYTMDHTASVFMLNAKGEFEGTIAYREDTGTALEKLRKLLAKG